MQHSWDSAFYRGNQHRHVIIRSYPSKNLVLARLGRAIPLFLLPDTQSEWTGAASAGRKALMRFADEEGAVVVYAGAGAGESVGEGVFAGRRLILAGQRILAESDPFTTGITCATMT